MASRKGLVRLTAGQKEKLSAALGNPAFISYAQIAAHAGVSRPAAIRHAQLTQHRPPGNFFDVRLIKQPKLTARIVERHRKMEQFVRDEVVHTRGVSANDLMRKYGGTKAAAVALLARLESAGVRVIRRTPADQEFRGHNPPVITQVVRKK